MTGGNGTRSGEERALSLLGLVRRAGGVVAGVDRVLAGVRTKAPEIAAVRAASDASARTAKQIADKCAFYGVRYVKLGADSSVLAERRVLVSSCAAVAVLKRGPWKPLCDALGDRDGKIEK